MGTWRRSEPAERRDAWPLEGQNVSRQGGITDAQADPDGTREETIFSLLAARAQSHSRRHLALTAVVGLVDAVALAWAHPALWWVAAVLAAGGAYGAWGVADRAVTDRIAAGALHTPVTGLLRVLREVTALLGLIAILAAVGGIWDASLGGWRH